jgi:RNA polymerase sigma-70 factor (ECF subfamily)
LRIEAALDVGARWPGPRTGPADEPSAVTDVAVVAAEPAGLDAALARARAGDESGFMELWRALHPPLLRYLRVRTADGGEDVAGETWLQVVRDLSSFRGDADGFRAWLFTVARNRSVDAARSRAARPVVLVPDIVAVADTGTAASAESQALERLSTRAALDLVATLPPDQAEMVALRVVAGLDVAVVARIVGKSPGAVRVSVHRGLRVLSQSVEVS